MNRQWKHHLLERMKKIGSTVYADVIDASNGMDYNVKPVNFKEPLVGQVRTVFLHPGDNLFLHHAIYKSAPGDILVVDGKGHTEAAYLGELMAGAAQKLGLKGIVIDGLVRDKKDLGEMDIQIYAKGFVSAGPTKEGPGLFDETISCGGVVVSPNDYLVADEDGVVVIPESVVESTLEKAEKKLEYEKARLQKIQSYSKEDEMIGTIEPDWLQQKMEKYNL
ncbi:RraA family protein [Natribacillus halophilus]|uniref:Putative 4-hydroxy-4-methyl-2-oxoglutarate aldolase n=1 Tax=Natribacillus halophilus TaxID=549003 RepID=A0A1G8LD12_9BACI|nr:RraA family protein [Natribacillus halophilus]SDI53110.1 RraA famliy [Natribacillus halophilus]